MKDVLFLLTLMIISQSCELMGQKQQECTERFMDLSLVTYRAEHISIAAVGNDLDNELRVLQEYQFNCSSTNITSLILGIDVRIVTSSRNLYPSVQVFRPNGSLVTGSERTIYYSTSNVSGVFEYPLNPPIPVMSGDLLAVSQPTQGNSVVRVYYISGITANSQEFNYGNTFVDLNESPITDQLILVYPVTDGYCVNSTNSINASFIKENALTIHDSRRPSDNRQYLYPDIVFSCNGSLTKWIYGGIDRGNNPPNRLPELQIWRQLGPNNYNKIGSSLVNASTMIGTNLYEFIPQTPLQFQEEDIFGFYFPHKDESSINLYEQDGSGPINYRTGSVNNPLSELTQNDISEDGIDFLLVTVEISVMMLSSETLLPSATVAIESSLIPSQSLTLSLEGSIKTDPTTAVTTPLNERTTTENYPSTSNYIYLYTSSEQTSLSTTKVVPSSSPTNNSTSSLSSLIMIIAGVTIALIIIIFLIICTLSIIVFKKRDKIKKGRKQATEIDENELVGLNNPIYEDNSKEAIPSSTENESCFYAEAGMPAPNYEEPNPLEYSVPVQLPNNERRTVVPTMVERKNADSSNIYFEMEDSIYYNTTGAYDAVDGSFFVESASFWLPGSDCSSIYEQLSRNKFRELYPGHIKVEGHLGSGQFGSVSKGVWESPTGPVDVAIKTLNNNTSEDEKVKFLQEAAIMGQFHHPNIVRLHGMVTVGEPLMIVLELIPHGDMRQYLHTLQPQPGELVASTVPGLLLSFCRQIASGMEYLSKKGFVHRDLAARNILIADKEVCKISDFGMSRDLQNENYYLSSGGQIPIKWTAPEALHYKKYSSASDVWSYGALLYEIWSLGYKPFHDMTNQQAIRKIESGVRLSPPPGCPREVYKIMMQCWHPERDHRPTFAILVTSFSQSDSSLISWYPIDTECHPLAGVLGAPLEAGQHMFTDLQSVYL